MPNSSTGNSANAAKNLLNQAQGFAGPGSQLYNQFQSSLGGAQQNQSNTLNTLNPALNQDITTGGYDPTQLSNLRGETQTLANTGGYDPSQIAKLTSGYDTLAQTGGFTPEQAQGYVRQATEGTTATGESLLDQAKRGSVATGGLGTGGGMSQLARQLGQTQATNTLNAKNSLNQLETQNKLAGLGGETSLAGQVAGAKQAGTAQQLGLEGNVAGGSEAATGQLNQLYNTQTGEITARGQQMLQTLGLDFSTQEEAANILAKISQNPSMFQSLMGTVGSTLSAVGGAFGGG